MKIDNRRIFTADIYEVTNSTITRELKESLNQGDVMGSYNFNDRKTNKGVVVIYFEKEKGYVPVWYLKNMIDYAKVKLNPNPINKYILKEEPGFMPENGKRFIKNIQPLFSVPGKTSLSELIGIQKLQNDRDDTYSGGMELM